jgi:hypothetical protein
MGTRARPMAGGLSTDYGWCIHHGPKGQRKGRPSSGPSNIGESPKGRLLAATCQGWGFSWYPNVIAIGPAGSWPLWSVRTYGLSVVLWLSYFYAFLRLRRIECAGVIATPALLLRRSAVPFAT